MRCQEAVVVFLIFVSILGCGHGDESSDFVKTKEDEVQNIAEAAVQNYLNTCGLVNTCARNCSRLECYPSLNQKAETTCVYIDNNTQCSNRTGSTCNSVEANFVRGYVRTPPLDFLSIGGTQANDLDIYLGESICAQRNLDDTFISVNNTLRSNSSLDYFYNLYFGAADGSFRYYPGRELLSENCGLYDPRIRPWYTGAISVLKDVVVLIDTGSAMQQTSFLDTTTSYLERTTALVAKLVQTITGGDRVTVIPVNASGSVPGQPYSQYKVPTSQLDFSDPNFLNLLSYLGNNSVFAGDIGSNGNGAATNFTDGFVEAASTFAGSSPSNSMKIVILITNSESQNVPGSGDFSTAANLTTSGVKLFVYDLNSNNTSWGTYTCDDGEDPQLMSVNPLLWLSSYFSFLARARLEVTGPSPYWQNPYVDASDLGLVITVAYPAMSSDGLQLLGVAGIDVQLAGLDSDPVLKQGVESLLTGSSYGQSAKNPNAGNLSICNSKYVQSCPGFTPGQTYSLCYDSSQPASDEQLLDLLCCPDCAKESKHSSIALGVSLGVLGGVLLLLALSGFFLVMRLRRRKAARSRRELALNDFSYDTLKKSTNGFATSNIIGKGSFGTVFKATLGSEAVAVKQLNQPADRAEDFEAEIKILGITNHPNLVELKGTCFQPTQCFLVYELVENGDLHDWLWPPTTGPCASDSAYTVRFLTWNKRRKIARGVARGLNYLHRGLEPNGTVFHLDIKPHNILLEYNLNPKIADFGISQLYEPGYTFKVASVVRGTFGYIAPEVLQGQMKPSSKLDVYSYGMVLLQLMSGRKIDDPDVAPFLLQWARNHVEDGFLEKVVDENLIMTVREDCREDLTANCKQLIGLALRCLSERPEFRPEMTEVLETIDSLREVADRDTPSLSDYSEYSKGSRDYEDPSEEVNIPKSGCLLPFSGSKHFEGPFQQLKSPPEDQAGSKAKNPEISTLVTSPVNAGDNSHDIKNQSSGSQDGSSNLAGRSSVDTSLTRAMEMASVQKEPKARTLKRSSSLM